MGSLPCAEVKDYNRPVLRCSGSEQQLYIVLVEDEELFD